MTTPKTTRSGIVAALIAANLLVNPIISHAAGSALTGKAYGQNREQIEAAMPGRNYVVEIDSGGRIKQVVDAGAKGTGKDALTLAATTAGAPAQPATTSSIGLPINYQGQEAVDRIGPDLPKVAAQYGLTPDKLEELLLTDSAIRIDSRNQIFYVDDAAEDRVFPGEAAAGIAAQAPAAAITNLQIGLNAATANAFKLHSKPGASKTIYLDFDGYTATGTAWSAGTLSAAAFDLDNNPGNFSDSELNSIIGVWNRVAEDYSPFDVDITTEQPASDALLRSNASDNNYGTRVVITKSDFMKCGCGGIAYLGVVGKINNTVYQPAWVFQQALAGNEKYIAEAVAHEAGHTLGLFHDGSSSTGYYSGHGSGATGWAPIMGVGYYKNVTQFSSGAYPGANNQQDDLAVMAANGFSARQDDTGNTFSTATALSSGTSGANAAVQIAGIIEKSDDIDMYRLVTPGGTLSLAAAPVASGPNLDIKLTLFKANGAPVIVNAPENDLSANISTSVPAGTYFLSVAGSAHAASGGDYGYPVYGSLGQYKLTGNYVSSTVPMPPVAVITASALAGPASLSVSFSANSSIGNGKITSYQWSFGDGTSSTSQTPVHVYGKAGVYNAMLTVTNEFLMTHSQSVTITVTPPPLLVLSPSSLRLSVSRTTSSTKAQVTVTVLDDKKRTVANALVKGIWSGSFSGATSGKTDSTGAVTQMPVALGGKKGGSATYTLTGIEAPSGYVYYHERTPNKVVTLTW